MKNMKLLGIFTTTGQNNKTSDPTAFDSKLEDPSCIEKDNICNICLRNSLVQKSFILCAGDEQTEGHGIVEHLQDNHTENKDFKRQSVIEVLKDNALTSKEFMFGKKMF